MRIDVTEAGCPPIRYQTDATDVIVGRSPACDLVVDRPFISGRHLRVLRGGVVHDLGSTNGSFVEGRLLEQPEWIGDRRLTIGGLDVELRVTDEPASAPSGVAASPGSATLAEGDAEVTAVGPDGVVSSAFRRESALVDELAARAADGGALAERVAEAPRTAGTVTDFFVLEALRFLGEIEALVEADEPRALALLAFAAANADDRRARERVVAHLEGLVQRLERGAHLDDRAALGKIAETLDAHRRETMRVESQVVRGPRRRR